MRNKYVYLNNNSINFSQKIIGFPEKNMYFEFQPNILEALEYINMEDGAKLGNIIETFPDLDIEDILIQLSEYGLIDFLDEKIAKKDGVITSNQSSYYLGIMKKIFVSNFSIYFYLFISITVIYLLVQNNFYVPNTSSYTEMKFFNIFLIVYVISMFLTFIHELGHWFFAKLCGVKSSIAVSQRGIVFLVFECRMNGIWMATTFERVLIILGGIIIDILVLLIMIVFSSIYKLEILELVIFTHWTKFLFHCIILFKTDLYYLLLFTLNQKRIIKILEYVSIIPMTLLFIMYVMQFLIIIKTVSYLEIAITCLILAIPVILFLKERKVSKK